jgi:hypothetical protein
MTRRGAAGLARGVPVRKRAGIGAESLQTLPGVSIGAILTPWAALNTVHMGEASGMTAESGLAPTIYTIGHSDHELERFVELLQRHQIDTVVDVRSQPYSRWVPAFNREALQGGLQEAGLTYVFLGEALGGRPADPALYNGEGAVTDYDRIAAMPAYQAGLTALLRLADQASVVIMCSEADYHACHRSRLITPSLLARDVRVIHILPDGRTVDAGPEFTQLSLF